MWLCCLCTDGDAVYTLPERRPVQGATSPVHEIVPSDQALDQVEVYDNQSVNQSVFV